MLSVGPGAPRFSPSQDIRVILSLAPYGNVPYRQRPLSWFRIPASQVTGAAAPLQQDRIPAVEDESRHQKGAQQPAVSEVDPLDIVEMIREGLLVLDPDLTVRFANRSLGDAFTVTPEDTPRDKEGLQ